MRMRSNWSRRILFSLLVFFTLIPTAFAQCVDWPNKNSIPDSWQNPKSAADDIVLQLESGIQIVFREVPINTRSLYGEGTYRMGSAEERLFETQLEVRISSAITGADGRRALLFGKYEISKGQYAMVAGQGDFKAGIAALSKNTGDRKLARTLEKAISGAGSCKDQMPIELQNTLAEPITYLSHLEYQRFVSDLNEQCIATKGCAAKLRSLTRNKEVAAFMRLPAEHEWEYVARRGGAQALGKINVPQMQRDLPVLPNSDSLLDYAHLGGSPDRLIPIGSRRAVDGLYDVLGNAQELMQNSFTSETGYGAVGGYTARGGHYRMQPDQVRVSRRSELLPFRVDDDTGKISRQKFPYSGLRLALSSPVIGSALRLGSSKLEEEFRNQFQDFGTKRDRGGDTFAEAESLGVLRGETLKVSDKVGREDTSDFFSVELVTYARLRLEELVALPGTVISIYSNDQRKLRTLSINESNNSLLTPPLLPGNYIVGIEAPKNTIVKAGEYSIAFQRTPIADTGVPTASNSVFDNAAQVANIGIAPVYRSGFVGRGDIADVFPFKATTRSGGIEVKLERHKSPLIVRILSQRQDIISEKEIAAGQSAKIVAPFRSGGRGFVQIAARQGSLGSTYRSSIRMVETVPQGFFNSHNRAAQHYGGISKGHTYSGFMGAGTAELHFKVYLNEYRKLRISLTGLDADIDMRVRKNGNETMSGTHVQRGSEPEFFIEDMPKGHHVIRLALKDRSKVTGFKVRIDESKPSRVKSLSPSEAKAKASTIYLSTGSKNSRGEVAGIKYHKLKAWKALESTITLSDFQGRADLNLQLEDDTGNVLASSTNSAGRSEKMTVAINPSTTYFLRVEAVGVEASSKYALNIFSQETARSPVSAGHYGPKVQEHRDWIVTRTKDNRCYALTEAATFSPKGSDVFYWKPTLYIGYERGSKSIYMSVLYKSNDKSSSRASSQILSGSRWRNVSLTWKKNWLKPLDRKGFISNVAVRGFTKGTALRVSGTIGGKAYTVEYSLRGYSAANRAANRLCGGRAQWTVR